MLRHVLLILVLSSPCWALRADINRDGRVDMLDFAILCDEWLQEDNMGLGPELITNGEFDDGSGWMLGGMEAIADGYLSSPGLVLANQEVPGIVSGKTFRVSLDILNEVDGGEMLELYFWDGDSEYQMLFEVRSSGHYSADIVANANYPRIQLIGLFTGWIDNVSVREVLPEDAYRLYRGQDGDIDYETGVAEMALADTEVSIAAQDLPPGTVWHFVRRQVRVDCGLESASSDPCIIVVNADGSVSPGAPNVPIGLTAEALVGGKVRLRWRYSTDRQAKPPHGFAVYQAQAKPFDDTPAGLVVGGMGLMDQFTWISDVLADGMWLFAVRSFNNDGGLSDLSSVVSVTVDGLGPPAIQTLLAEVSS